MRKIVTCVLFVLMSASAYASHIVGGEIEMLHIRDFRYRVNLIYYFDVVSNPGRRPEAEDTVQLFVYRKSDNKQMRFLTLKFQRKSRVGYTQPACSQNEIVTDKVIYTLEVNFPPEQYSDPAGYYMVWARCCRNYTILNIYSQDPLHGQAAGQTFYHEFQPVMMNGVRFINSSPKDFPTLNDYACPSRSYYVDFAGKDDDGDSLTYSLATPLSTVSVTAVPPATPGPYPEVNWINGFGPDRMMNGSPKNPSYPDLRISNAGFLRVTPRSLGLYVFAVKVEEFRDKKKIGETRRDFQMLVTDCKLAVPPQISGRPKSGGALKRGNMSISFSNSVSDEDRCIVVNVTDADATRAVDNFEENISLRIIPLNFKATGLTALLPKESTATIKNSGSVEFNICFPQCPLIPNGAYQVGVIAFDDACALPLSDTLRVEVRVQPPHNERAKFTPPDEVYGTLNEGESNMWPFEATDAEGDELTFFALTQGFSMSESGMKTKITSNVKGDGLMQGELTWDAFCEIYNFTKLTDFTLKLLVDDADVCDLNDPDTLTYRLRVILPPNKPPIIDTDLTANPEEYIVDGITRRIYDALKFNVTGKDTDGNLISIKMIGDQFDPAQYGITFAKASGQGTVTSSFTWDLVCSKFDLTQKSDFNIGFVAVDSINKCRVHYKDSLVVKVKVLEPYNNRPQLAINNLTEGLLLSNNSVSMAPGNELALRLDVRDADDTPKDLLTLSLLKVSGSANDGTGDPPDNFLFENVSGQSILTSNFRWTPLCSLFTGDVREGNYFFDFRYADNRCITALADTIRIRVHVKDTDTRELVAEPANVFTPNNDGFNDYYSMERIDIEGNRINILPPDNCTGVFQFVRIYNRWGETVFQSTERDFRWLGTKESAGVYYYLVSYSNRVYKGTVSLRN